MSLIPKDAKGFEKFVYVFVPVVGLGLLLYMYLSAFGVFHNFYSEACKLAGGWWKIPGLLLLGGAIWQYKQLVDGEVMKPHVMIILLALSLLAMAGFTTPYWI